MNHGTPALAERLSDLSARDVRDDFAAIDWPDRVDPSASWFQSPELVTLYDTPLWDALGDGARMRLSFYEAVHFYSLNIHGEAALMAGIAARMYTDRFRHVARYLHHFLGEENEHSKLFGTFCLRYAGRIYPDRNPLLPDADDDQGRVDLRFIGRVVVFEEVADEFNRIMARDARLHPIARAINACHHRQESRHLAFGRRLLADLWRTHAAERTVAERRALGGYLFRYLDATLRGYYEPHVYQDAGVIAAAGPRFEYLDAFKRRELALRSPAAARVRARIESRVTQVLSRCGIEGGAP
jgi:hypothetical protein